MLDTREIWVHTGWDGQEAREFVGAHLNELDQHTLNRLAGIVAENTGILPMYIDDYAPMSAEGI